MAVLDKFITAKEMLGYRLEDTPYTAESEVDYDLLVRDITISITIDSFKRKYSVGDFDQFVSVQGNRMAEITFVVDLQGSGTATTAPKVGKLFKSSGFRETVGGFGVVYTKDANMNNVPGTMEVVFKGTGQNAKGVKAKIRGCMGNVEITVNQVGEPIQASFTMMGAIVGVTDIAAGSVPGFTGYDTTVPPSTLSANLQFRGDVMNANSVNFNMNNTIEMLKDFSQDEGYEGAYLVDADPTGSIDPYLSQETDRFLYQLATGETGPAEGDTVFWAGATGTQGNFIRMDAFSTQLVDTHSITSREGTEANPLELQFNRGSTGAPLFQVCFGSYTGIAGY